ncbi:hypothetical protein [Buchananella hordeovulneris]|uniref:hypothetical protein n=1 Tax=Buchananella hordeovulneris TaxID=52770 RepID=UPI000F600BC2|nr:hypothetical protein [Buchananella hordeovulneris]RRD42992.1 hypothetical protein EII13_08120 [Buchananella hordeovulneris]
MNNYPAPGSGPGTPENPGPYGYPGAGSGSADGYYASGAGGAMPPSMPPAGGYPAGGDSAGYGYQPGYGYHQPGPNRSKGVLVAVLVVVLVAILAGVAWLLIAKKSDSPQPEVTSTTTPQEVTQAPQPSEEDKETLPQEDPSQGTGGDTDPGKQQGGDTGGSTGTGDQLSLTKMTCNEFMELAAKGEDEVPFELAFELGKIMIEKGVDVQDSKAAEQFGINLGIACFKSGNGDRPVADVAREL